MLYNRDYYLLIDNFSNEVDLKEILFTYSYPLMFGNHANRLNL